MLVEVMKSPEFAGLALGNAHLAKSVTGGANPTLDGDEKGQSAWL